MLNDVHAAFFNCRGYINNMMMFDLFPNDLLMILLVCLKDSLGFARVRKAIPTTFEGGWSHQNAVTALKFQTGQ